MSSNSKSNEQNVLNLDNFIKRVETFGSRYNPSEKRLTIPELVQLRSDGEAVLSRVNTARDACNNAITARTSSFAGLPGLLTRTMNALRIAGVSEQTIGQAAAIIRAIRINKDAEALPAVPEDESATKRRNKLHKSSMETRTELFAKLISFLKSIPTYKPNEQELTIEGLEARLQTIKLAHSAYLSADAQLEIARLDRNAILYAEKTGLVDTALDTKRYVKSVFGAVSPEYKSISDISFVNRKLT